MAQEFKITADNFSIQEYMANVESEAQRQDCKQLIKMMQDITGDKPKVWGGRMVGFGTYHYKYESGREGDAFLTGFATRKQGLTVYNMPGFSQFEDLMARLGKHKCGKSCLYIKCLADIDVSILETLIKKAVDHMVKKYG